jgi:sugar-phosphatase
MQIHCSALLFDLDGVLVDSRSVVERVCRRWALRHHLDPQDVLRVAHGRRTRDTVKTLTPHVDVDREVEWLDRAELVDVDGLREVPGARRFLETLRSESWGVVTSCGQALARLRLTSVGLPLPKILVTSEEVERGKPAPDGYLVGARRLGYDPAACVVFEDAPPGIAAARAAGARVIALRTTHPDADFSGADVVMEDFERAHVRRDGDGYVIRVE